MPTHSNCSITKKTRRSWSTSGFEDIATAILGPLYELSVVLVGDRRARTLNKTYRGKDSPANVLSFPLTKTAGEIFLNLARIEREASAFGFTAANHARFLLIHGCLHLKGYTHGSTMERAERKFIKKFGLR